MNDIEFGLRVVATKEVLGYKYHFLNQVKYGGKGRPRKEDYDYLTFEELKREMKETLERVCLKT